MKDLYSRTDTFIQRLKKKIRVEFNRMSVMSFDELNVINTKQQTEEMYQRLIDFNQKEFVEIAKECKKFTEQKLTDEEKEKTKNLSVTTIVAAILLAFNPITNYLYYSEAERKRMRLTEEILTARQFHDKQKYLDSLRKGANYWFTQGSQYGIDVADGTALAIYREAGIKKLKWVTENDERVCSTCRDRNGVIYDIDDVPTKTHYKCRCHLEPYRLEKTLKRKNKETEKSQK